ncbi:Nucleotide-binding universal stress protein, UspA family [Halobacillus alkaliphilus]|uniref:Nucleotide-binding universal stress protein, UspA family n=1 Tax=Halobacillus alkaliphilus TaxID=396056 RepID=A0A1I2SJT8_9BACI|nr:universal stress protein [Halobacillus alkaliphilus]SFG53018.1 Nucleotide-binding universal stress protein, UspA family [Halobacillus alkaliphilus]
MFSHILLASDGSSHAVRAAEHALQLARLSEDSQITILYAISGSTSKSDVLSENAANLSMVRKGRLFSTEGVFKKAGMNYDVKILKGDPGPAIVHYVNENQYDVVVIGSRGLNGFQEMVLGSVSHKVAKRVDCPVLIIK